MQSVAVEWAAARRTSCSSRARRRAPSFFASTAKTTWRRSISTAGRAVSLDPDTFTSPDSRDVALLAAGAAIGGVEVVLQSASRPRAGAGAAAGSSRRARQRDGVLSLQQRGGGCRARAGALGLARVVVMDYDVHHGNGTQWIFYDDPRVLYISTHQYPYLPGHGRRGGRGARQRRRVHRQHAAGSRGDRRRLRGRLRGGRHPGDRSVHAASWC